MCRCHHQSPTSTSSIDFNTTTETSSTPTSTSPPPTRTMITEQAVVHASQSLTSLSLNNTSNAGMVTLGLGNHKLSTENHNELYYNDEDIPDGDQIYAHSHGHSHHHHHHHHHQHQHGQQQQQQQQQHQHQQTNSHYQYPQFYFHSQQSETVKFKSDKISVSTPPSPAPPPIGAMESPKHDGHLEHCSCGLTFKVDKNTNRLSMSAATTSTSLLNLHVQQPKINEKSLSAQTLDRPVMTSNSKHHQHHSHASHSRHCHHAGRHEVSRDLSAPPALDYQPSEPPEIHTHEYFSQESQESLTTNTTTTAFSPHHTHHSCHRHSHVHAQTDFTYGGGGQR